AGGRCFRALAINLAPPVAGVQLLKGNGEQGMENGKSWKQERVLSSALPFPAPHSPFPAVQAIALSMIWVSWVRLTAPIWVACTLPSLNTIRVGMLRTL